MPTAVIIDDSPLIRAQLRQILTRMGCTVLAEGGSGDDVRGLYERHKPDLVTLDIVMPGKDGVTAAIELLKDFPAARVVMCTSLSSRDKILACQKGGVKHYLLKPFDPARAEMIFNHVLAKDSQPGVSA